MKFIASAATVRWRLLFRFPKVNLLLGSLITILTSAAFDLEKDKLEIPKRKKSFRNNNFSLQFESSRKSWNFWSTKFKIEPKTKIVVVAVLVGILAISAICLAAFKGRQICRKFCKKEDAAQVRKIVRQCEIA